MCTHIIFDMKFVDELWMVLWSLSNLTLAMSNIYGNPIDY